MIVACMRHVNATQGEPEWVSSLTPCGRCTYVKHMITRAMRGSVRSYGGAVFGTVAAHISFSTLTLQLHSKSFKVMGMPASCILQTLQCWHQADKD